MIQEFSFSQFRSKFPTDEECLEEIKRKQFPSNTECLSCGRITTYYKIKNRTSYSCEFCRYQIYPLKNTIFEKTTTPLRLWFYTMFIMTHTRGDISIRKLQKELGVTYKTAWRMSHLLKDLMKLNNADLLTKSEEVIRWTFFNKFEFKVVQKQSAHNE